MTAKFVVAHRMDPNNVGDIASNPLQYFLKREEYEIIDVASIGEMPYSEDLPLIVGGGGLIGNNFMGDFYGDLINSSDRLQLEKMWGNGWNVFNPKYKDLYQRFNEKFQALMSETLAEIPANRAPRFIWGAGHNGESESEFTKIKWPKAFSAYREIGLRDYNEHSRFQWAPCASCMHPALSKKYEIKNDIIWFEHKKQLMKGNEFGEDPIPRFINSGGNVEQTIELLGSANTILTNSYHGAYWGTLLKKKVLLVGAWSSKFKFMKHKPTILGKKDHWKDFIESAVIHETALDECREATTKFWNKIKERT
jgi:hypothetical protein